MKLTFNISSNKPMKANGKQIIGKQFPLINIKTVLTRINATPPPDGVFEECELLLFGISIRYFLRTGNNKLIAK